MKTVRASHPEITRELHKWRQDVPADDSRVGVPALVGALLEDALRENVSDIYLDPRSAGYQLRFRIDGVLANTANFEREQGPKWPPLSNLLPMR